MPANAAMGCNHRRFIGTTLGEPHEHQQRHSESHGVDRRVHRRRHLTCCPLGLLGIVGIVFSSKVNTLLAAGDIPGAQRASASAKTWAIVASVLAVIGILLTIFMFMSGGMATYMEVMKAAQGGA